MTLLMEPLLVPDAHLRSKAAAVCPPPRAALWMRLAPPHCRPRAHVRDLGSPLPLWQAGRNPDTNLNATPHSSKTQPKASLISHSSFIQSDCVFYFSKGGESPT